jgi:hypothetical protein
MTSESTRFLGQPNEIKPTEGAVGGEFWSHSIVQIDNAPMSALEWSEIKHEVRDDLLGGEVKESRIGLNALDRLEKDFAAIYPGFPENPAVLLDAGKEEVTKQVAGLRACGLLHSAENDVLNHIFRLLEAALVKAA